MFPVHPSSFDQEGELLLAHLSPSARRRPMPVQFIDDDLKDLHNALRHPLSAYDSNSGRYVVMSSQPAQVNLGPMTPQFTNTILEDSDGSSFEQSQALVPASTPMIFWDSIFPVSIDRFKTLWPDEPQGRDKSGCSYSIRKKTTWEDIYAQLQKAREFYDGDTKGLWGRHAKSYTKKKRSFIDHTTPIARQAVRFVPQMEYTTPVVAAVQVVVDAFETTSRVRGTVTTSLEQQDLERKFSSIELFLATFPKDRSIHEASVELIAATLKAIEDVIGFFLESNARKTLSATFRGKDYQKTTLESIEQIGIRSDQLLEAAQKSHISETKHKLDTVLKGTALSFLGQREVSDKVTSVLKKLDERESSDAFLRNTLMDLLKEAQDQKRRELEEKQRLNDDITDLKEQIGKLRETTISATNSTSSSPNPLIFSPIMQFSPVDFSALNPTNSLAIPQSVGYQATSPWAPSPQYLEARQPLPSSAHSRSTSPTQLDITTLRSLFTSFESMEEVDLSAILENENQSIPFREKRKADLIVSTKQFHDWMVTNKSSELLIHGEYRRSRSATEPVSALSGLYATLSQTFRKSGQQQLALVFFCGSHTEHDDQQRGPGAMMCSFIAQLAKLWPSESRNLEAAGSHSLSQLEVEMMVKDGNLPKLCGLFERLVQLLPEQATLFCIIDGILHYETDEFEEGLLVVLKFLLGLARNRELAATIKILASSPTTTDLVQNLFRDDDSCFISLAEIRDLGQGLGSMQLEVSSADEDSSHSEESDENERELEDAAR